MKKLLILLLILFVFSGCSFVEERLDTPTNLRYEGFNLYFDPVDNADSYIIDFGDYTEQTDKPYLELYEFGDYEVKVKAEAAGYQDSYYSEKLSFSVVADFPVPTNLNYVDGILFWDSVPNAIHYAIYVGTNLYTTTDTNKSLSLTSSYRTEIKVRAIFRLGASEFTPSIYASYSMTVLSSTTKNYSKQSAFNLELKTFENNAEVLSVTNIMEEPVALSNFLVVDHTIFFKSEYLSTLMVGNHIFILETNFGNHEFKINITNTNRPYMITSSEIFANFIEDVVVTYELFGGEVLSLSGNEITESDYSISGNTVTIDKDYIKDQFVKLPSRTTLILGYTLESGDNVVIGYIFIKKNS